MTVSDDVSRRPKGGGWSRLGLL